MYALYNHPIYFKFQQKYQQYGPCFQTIFPFLTTILQHSKKNLSELQLLYFHEVSLQYSSKKVQSTTGKKKVK